MSLPLECVCVHEYWCYCWPFSSNRRGSSGQSRISDFFAPDTLTVWLRSRRCLIKTSSVVALSLSFTTAAAHKNFSLTKKYFSDSIIIAQSNKWRRLLLWPVIIAKSTSTLECASHHDDDWSCWFSGQKKTKKRHTHRTWYSHGTTSTYYSAERPQTSDF